VEVLLSNIDLRCCASMQHVTRGCKPSGAIGASVITTAYGFMLLLLCRMVPPVGCSGTSFDSLLRNIAEGKISQLASRERYPYVAGPAGTCQAALGLPNQLPEGDRLVGLVGCMWS
jgi:hypothetical protein